MGARCLRCRATPVTLSLIDVLRQVFPELSGRRVYELSSRGPLVRYLHREGAQVTLSEYFDDVPPGAMRNGVQCQDVARLTYEDNSFDLCTSTEVFEHVPDDAGGFREVCRVLRPGGYIILTVPMIGAHQTVTRAVPAENGIVHLLPPEFHRDRLRGKDGVLCYRNYGDDILDRLATAGFVDARLAKPSRDWFAFSRPVVVARKAPPGR